jgi:diacylglycerol kinase (ATP)
LSSRVCESTVVVWNPSAGTADSYSQLRAELERRPETLVRETTSHPEARDLVRQCVEDGTELVVAAGGDGTLNAVANGIALASRTATMAVLPVGTGNDFARTLGIPADPAAALALLEQPRVRNVDLIHAEGATGSRFIINMANGGNSQKVAECLDDEMKQRWGPFCYIRGAIEVLVQLEKYQATLRFDDGPPETFGVFNIFLGNGQTCGAGLKVAPLASPEDGLMDVMIVLDGGPIDVATLAARFLVQDFLDSEMVVHRRASRVWIDSEPKMLFVTDGDADTELPATFTILPGVLPVVVGPEYSVPGVAQRAGEEQPATVE